MKFFKSKGKEPKAPEVLAPKAPTELPKDLILKYFPDLPDFWIREINQAFEKAEQLLAENHMLPKTFGVRASELADQLHTWRKQKMKLDASDFEFCLNHPSGGPVFTEDPVGSLLTYEPSESEEKAEEPKKSRSFRNTLDQFIARWARWEVGMDERKIQKIRLPKRIEDHRFPKWIHRQQLAGLRGRIEAINQIAETYDPPPPKIEKSEPQYDTVSLAVKLRNASALFGSLEPFARRYDFIFDLLSLLRRTESKIVHEQRGMTRLAARNKILEKEFVELESKNTAIASGPRSKKQEFELNALLDSWEEKHQEREQNKRSIEEKAQLIKALEGSRSTLHGHIEKLCSDFELPLLQSLHCIPEVKALLTQPTETPCALSSKIQSILGKQNGCQQTVLRPPAEALVPSEPLKRASLRPLVGRMADRALTLAFVSSLGMCAVNHFRSKIEDTVGAEPVAPIEQPATDPADSCQGSPEADRIRNQMHDLLAKLGKTDTTIYSRISHATTRFELEMVALENIPPLVGREVNNENKTVGFTVSPSFAEVLRIIYRLPSHIPLTAKYFKSKANDNFKTYPFCDPNTQFVITAKDDDGTETEIIQFKATPEILDYCLQAYKNVQKSYSDNETEPKQ